MHEYHLSYGSSATPTKSLTFSEANDAFYRTAEAIMSLDNPDAASCAWVSLTRDEGQVTKHLVNWTKTSDERPYHTGDE